MSSKDIISLYERHARHWVTDRSRTGVSFEKPWLDRLIAVLPADKEILDIGCGSGEPIADYMIALGYDRRRLLADADFILPQSASGPSMVGRGYAHPGAGHTLHGPDCVG
jgi:SAM-dependent methyltransferase